MTVNSDNENKCDTQALLALHKCKLSLLVRKKKKAFSDNELFVKFTLHHCSINGSKHNLALSGYNFPFLSSFYLPAIVNRDRIETQDQYKAWFFENQHLESC